MSKLMNPDTRRTTKILIVALIAILFLVLAVLGFLQDPSWGLTFLILGAIVAPLAAIFVLNPRVNCMSCGARGYIRDLEEDGTCPVCHGDWFFYDHWSAAFTARHWTGIELIDKSATSRWY